MKALILAAGFGTRLRPLTLDTAKPLLEVGGKKVLDHIFERILEVGGIEEVVLVGNGRFHDDLSRWARRQTPELSLCLVNDGVMEDEDKLGGVADLALGVEAALENDPDQDLLVLAGDNILGFSLHSFLSLYAEQRCPLILSHWFEGEVPPGRYGEVEADEQGEVLSFVEKPSRPVTNRVAVALYAFPPAVRGWLSSYLGSGNDPDGLGHFIAWLVSQTRVRAATADGPIFDIGNFESLETARRALSSGE